MLSQVLRIKLNSIKKYYFLLIFNVPFWPTTNPKADVQFSGYRPKADIRSPQNIRHPKVSC